ncbi:GPW/gp25 family protein [Fodinibius salsisoli]|uniref:GPW/gp25 family protein n=1 Tax=Fodinibius salsisoli TaxID=2820877 RepID=A0ABT3PQL6_9BACT|nr:GPW/gp25 family protein [Fodinibius salsisoli]MCW9708162.1 GPW/gp25 family protein [Fodinibius salsisoli]
MAEKNFLGTGWSFPPTFNRGKGGVQMTSDAEDINRSLQILFTTMIGERVMQPRYGCDLQQFLFEPIDTSMKSYMREIIRDAILYFEPRIRLLQLYLEPIETEGRIDITIEYEIKGTNSRFNFVYPFYIEEGTEIDNG